MEFVRKKGFHLKADPQVVGEVCQDLEKAGRLTAKNLVEASRPKNAPLHNEFEWNNTVAAAKYREVQAGYIIRSVAVKVYEVQTGVEQLELSLHSDINEPVTRFFHAVDLDGQGYDGIDTICEDEEKSRKLIKICLKDLKAFREKYYILRSFLPELFNTIDKTIERSAEDE